eukprot:1110774-Rhodomonas_salina.2
MNLIGVESYWGRDTGQIRSIQGTGGTDRDAPQFVLGRCKRAQLVQPPGSTIPSLSTGMPTV